MNYSIDYIQKKILDLEKKHDLLNLKIGNVKIWQATRTFIYYEIAQKTGAFDEMHTVKDNLSQRLSALPSFIISSIFVNPLFSLKKRHVIVYDHSRKVNVDGEYIDIYTHYYIKKLKEKGINYEIYEEPHQNRHYTRRDARRKHMDFILIMANLKAKFFPYRFSKEEAERIENLTREINNLFGIDFDLHSYFAYNITKFRSYYTFMNYLFSKKKPSQLVCMVPYGHPWLIKAAKDNGAEVIEIQHGTISDFHLGYHYPGTKKGSLEYFPDRIWLWDEYWKEMCELPVEDENLEVTEFEYLNRQKEKFAATEKEKNQVLIISQGSIGPRLAGMIYENIDRLGNYNIIYKLHPGEYDRWRSYESLLKLSKYPNVHVVDNNDNPLHQMLAKSEYVIGVYSTAIFESLYFECKVILADLPGVEYARGLVDKQLAKWFKRGDDLKTILQEYSNS